MTDIVVRSPVPFTGTVGAVSFHDGVATVDPEKCLAEVGYFKRAGYIIGGDPAEISFDDTAAAAPAHTTEVGALPSDAPILSASKADWIMYAEDKGIEVDEGAKRDEVIAAVRAASLA